MTLQDELKQLEILNTDNQYHGPKLIALYDYAIKRGADYIFQTDSDGQTSPKEFETFWKLREEYDGIFGNRTVREDGKNRAFVEKVVCVLIRIFFGVRIPDANAPFRLMKSKVVERYLYKMPKNYNLPNIMMATYYAYNKEKYKYIEIFFKPRRGGENSVNIYKIINIGWHALGDFVRFRQSM